jgi:hypothetical protein
MRPAPCGDGRSAHCARVVVRAQVAAMRRPGRSARARPRKGRCAKSGGCGAGAARASARRCGIRMESSARSRGRRASDGGGACHPSRALRLKRRCGSSPRSSARAVGRRCARRARTSTRSSGTPGDSACRPGAREAARDRCLADTAPYAIALLRICSRRSAAALSGIHSQRSRLSDTRRSCPTRPGGSHRFRGDSLVALVRADLRTIGGRTPVVDRAGERTARVRVALRPGSPLAHYRESCAELVAAHVRRSTRTRRRHRPGAVR